MTASGGSSGIGLRMLSRFNGANENGTTASTRFPATATRDSLFGNTETFSGLANIKPAFKLTGLDLTCVYAVTFYASRLGVSDNRQTRYTVIGAVTNTADLNAANNIDQSATLAGLRPSLAGELTISLSPGPANNNANHFTYLGVLDLAWTFDPPAPAPPTLDRSRWSASTFSFSLSGTPGATYWLQTSLDLATWLDLYPLTLDQPTRAIDIETANPTRFYRAIAP